MSQPRRNQSVVRQPTLFKSKRPRISKPRCDSQVDVNYDLSKPVTTHYLPKEREAAFAKPHHMITSSNSRISSKNMPRFSSNDMVHNHYLEEAKKKTQEHKHPRNSRTDSCVTKFLKEVNLRAKVPSNKTTKRNKPVEKISVPKKPERQIPKGHRFSIQKTFIVQKKTMTPRSCLRWKPTSKIFKTVGLRWVPTGKIFASSTTKVDSEPLNGLNADITNQYECEQTLDVSAGTLNLSAGTYFNPKEEGLRVCSELELHDHNNEQLSSKLVLDVVPPADKTAKLRQELEFLFQHHITMLRDECDKGRMPTKIELTLEQLQQGVSNDVLVSIEGVEELKRNVWIKGLKKAALPTLKAETRVLRIILEILPEHPSDTYVFTVKMEILLELTLSKLLVGIEKEAVKHVDSLSTMDNEVGVTSLESTIQTLPSFEEYTPPVNYPEEVKKTLGTPIEVEPLNETKLEEVGLNCNHITPFSSREVCSFDGPEPQPLLNSPSLDVSLGDVIGPEPPIKPYSSDSSRIKESKKKLSYFGAAAEEAVKRLSHADPTLLNDFEMAAEGNGDLPVPDLRTMEELCHPSLNGRGGTFMKRCPEECYDLIENMTAHHNDWDTLAQRSKSSSSITSSSDTKITALKAEMAEINKNLMRFLQVNQQVKAVTPNCETCSGPHSFNDCPATIGNTQNVYATGAYQAYQAPVYQASGYQAPVHQPQIPQPQVVTTNEFTNFMKANDAILKNVQTNMTSLTNSNLELQNMFDQFMKMNTASSSSSGTLSVERETEATKDMVHPTNNENTKDIQPSVIQTESPILNSEPVVAPIIELVASPVSAPRPNQGPSIPYPSRLQDQKLRDKANDQERNFSKSLKI
nr:reverse transcriptase domain-containing protein [Tanacetum cinerariifolium]